LVDPSDVSGVLYILLITYVTGIIFILRDQYKFCFGLRNKHHYPGYCSTSLMNLTQTNVLLLTLLSRSHPRRLSRC